MFDLVTLMHYQLLQGGSDFEELSRRLKVSSRKGREKCSYKRSITRIQSVDFWLQGSAIVIANIILLVQRFTFHTEIATMSAWNICRPYDVCAKFQLTYNRLLRFAVFDSKGEFVEMGFQWTFASMFRHIVFTFASYFLQCFQIGRSIFGSTVPVSKCFRSALTLLCRWLNSFGTRYLLFQFIPFGL